MSYTGTIAGPLNLDPHWCRQRQQRICELLARRGLERAILTSHENIQYATGFRSHRLMRAAVCLEADGSCVLAAPNAEPENVAADRVVTFEAQWHCTLRQDQMEAALQALAAAVSKSPRLRTGVEHSHGSPYVRLLLDDETGDPADIDADLWRLRRRKDPDELTMIRRAIDCTAAMYARARQIIEPGITELQVFNALHAAAVEAAGEPLTALGNDFQCNSPGGPPRDRAAQTGELFILDLGPAYRGYYADNCRTIAVDRQPTDEQLTAWDAIVAVLDMVESTVRPGVSCRRLFADAQAMLDEFALGVFFHHLGHGFGLFPHEAPHLNPNTNWDDVFEVGDTFTAEPGLYAPELKAGIRLEQNYLVTEHGVERLTEFLLDL
ncbi:M24 family metallopeptidase [bacterium]|nr:M24 family metallopeptidase [bacterium]